MLMNWVLDAKAGVLQRASGWTLAALAFGIAVVALLVGYWQTVQSLVWVWDHDGTYQYAFLIPPLSLWTAFNLRHEVRANRPVPSLWGVLAVAGLVFLWYTGHLLEVNLVQHFALVALFPALVLACWGWRALWALAFPLGYLVVFAVPWGDVLVGPLQDFTAHFAVRALELTGIRDAAKHVGSNERLPGPGCQREEHAGRSALGLVRGDLFKHRADRGILVVTSAALAALVRS